MRWRCPGGALEVPRRCSGSSLVVPWCEQGRASPDHRQSTNRPPPGHHLGTTRAPWWCLSLSPLLVSLCLCPCLSLSLSHLLSRKRERDREKEGEREERNKVEAHRSLWRERHEAVHRLSGPCTPSPFSPPEGGPLSMQFYCAVLPEPVRGQPSLGADVSPAIGQPCSSALFVTRRRMNLLSAEEVAVGMPVNVKQMHTRRHPSSANDIS